MKAKINTIRSNNSKMSPQNRRKKAKFDTTNVHIHDRSLISLSAFTGGGIKVHLAIYFFRSVVIYIL